MLPYTPLPPLPTAPAAGATAAQRQAFDDAMALYRAAVAAMQAAAQANTAEAIAGTIEAQDRLTAAQRAAAEALAAPSTTRHLYPQTRSQLVWDAVKSHPHVTSMTELQIVQTCERMVDAFLARHPPAA